ncbi:MAG: winged helix-turn-helix domain-containing protein, partial [Gemmataceae bacterium]
MPTKPMDSMAKEVDNTAATDEVAFDQKQQLQQTLRQGPDEKPRQQASPHSNGPKPSRWTLRTIRASIESLAHYSLSGVSRLLHRLGLKVRSAKVQHFSPDPLYLDKCDCLDQCLRHTAITPERVVSVFLDEMSYYRWPYESRHWADAHGVLADRQGTKQQQWRIIGALNARTGRVDYLDGYKCGREKVIAMYERLADVYDRADVVYV